jgi:hypothetical protein
MLAGLSGLSGYLLQPPEGGLPKGEIEKEDTTEVESTGPDIPPASSSQPPPSQLPPGFGVTDTTGRADSTLTFPSTQFAPIETIGPQTFDPGTSTKTTSTKRGILGLHPTALIAAMIALHIVVVGLVAK